MDGGGGEGGRREGGGSSFMLITIHGKAPEGCCCCWLYLGANEFMSAHSDISVRGWAVTWSSR